MVHNQIDPNALEQFQARLGGVFAPLLLLQDLSEVEEGFTRGMNAVTKKTLGRRRSIK